MTRWTTRKGLERGGGPWDKAKLAYTLGNWTLAGKVRYRGTVYPADRDESHVHAEGRPPVAGLCVRPCAEEETELTAAMETFVPVWETLSPREQAARGLTSGALRRPRKDF
jgi:hypothetical protein